MPKANPLKPGKTKAAVAANIARLKRDGYPQAQAVAIALREARTPGRKLPHAGRVNPKGPSLKSRGFITVETTVDGWKIVRDKNYYHYILKPDGSEYGKYRTSGIASATMASLVISGKAGKDRDKGQPFPKLRNYSYPDIASIKKVLGASTVSRLVNSTYPRLAISRAHERLMGKSDWVKAEAVAQLERYVKKAEGKRGNPARIEDLTPAQLTQQLKKWEGVTSALNSKLIDAGRGHERFSDSVARAKAGDKLAADHVAAAERHRDLYLEKERRLKYSGSLKRIKNPPSTSTSSDVRSPTKTSTSTYAHTAGNITVTGGAGAGATTRVVVRRNPVRVTGGKSMTVGLPMGDARRAQRAFLKSIYADYDPKHHDAFVIQYNREVDAGNFAKYEKARQRPQKNPSVLDISEMFQGDTSGKTVELKAANGAPSNLSRAGKLASLKLADRRATVRIPGAVVCIDTKKRLWLAGPRTPMFNRKANKGEGLDYGEIDTIAYVTAKSHVGNGRTFEYVHNFGEDGGRKPHLIIDDEGMAIIKGGDYQIREEGIID